MESQDCRLRPEHLGLVNGHVTFCTRGDCLARVTRVFAPPYFTKDFDLDVRFNGENADLANPTYTWTPACVERRGVAADSWNVTTRTFAIAGERGGILEVTAQNVHRDARDLSVEVSQKGVAGYCRVWRFDPPTESEAGHPAALVQGTTLPGGKNSAVFRAVPNRGVVRFFVAFALGAPERAKQVVTAALAEPERTVADAVADWDRRWNALKAKVPRFECDDKGLERLYERSLLHFALCEWNVDEFVVKPFYATGGLFGSCVCSYLWNLGGPYRMWPLIAPEAIKAHIAQYLKLDLTNCYAFSPVDGASVGPYYQINQEKMLFLIHSYVMETGDVGYLSETVAGKRIIDHVVDFALLFDDLSKDAVLVDYGAGGHSHLELRLGFRYDGVMPDMNLRRIALYYLADELCRAAGHRPKVDLVARAKALKALCREKLWDPQQGWFSGVCTDGIRTTRWTMQMFKALGWRGKVLDPDQEEALVGHLMDETEFLGPHGVHSLSKKDVAYHAQDVDNGGPGACPSFAPAIVNRLYRDGRTDEGDAILMRLKWLADSFPYWADSQFADRKDYRHNTPLQLNVEGGCLAQTIVFGLFGIDVGAGLAPTFKPHLPSGVKHLSLKGLRLLGKRYDVSVDKDKTVVTVDGDLAVSRQRPHRIFCGDDRTAYRDPAALYADGKVHLFFTLVETESDGLVHSYVATSQSSDLRTWSAPRKLTPRSDRDYSSPGNVVRDGDEWVLCFQSYPRPGNRDDGKVRYGDETARLYTMRSCDLMKWADPELLRVKGPDVCEKDMGRMIDPYLLRGADGRWWCFYKQNGASVSRSSDLRTWEYVGRTEAGENVCVVPSDGGYIMLHSPANGIAMKRSSDLVHWRDVPGLITLGQGKWEWAKGRLTAGFLLDARSVPGIGKFVLFFHGSGPRTELEGDFDRNASIGFATADRIEEFFGPIASDPAVVSANALGLRDKGMELTTVAKGCEPSDPVRSPAFFWMWNDRLEHPKLFAQLEDMRAHGVRNVCIHPFPKGFRPTSCPSRMEPEYLSEGFLAVVSNVIDRAASLGMHAYLYDEGGWPSGGACGQVARSDIEGRFRRREIGADGKVTAIDYPPGSPCPSILEKGETERFIELTHEKYARYLGGEFGKSVKITFTDEPSRHAGTPGRSLGWTADFAEVFKAKKGYDLVPFVGDLIRRNDETDDVLAAKRIDYCEVAADLFVERYVKPLRDWCRGHGILSGGHFNGEDEPVMSRHYGHGNLLRSLRYLDVPGVDVIWRQLSPQTDSVHRERSLPFPRYASSAAHQIGSNYALSETFGIYGDSLDPFELKWNVDFQLVRGINTFVFGYYSYSEWGPWMALFEPHFGPSSPCWDFMPHLFGYVTRCCETLSRGHPGAECAVLYDVRGLWAGGTDTEAAARAHDAVALALDGRQVDYDFFDEDILREGAVGQGTIRLGKMEYRTLVLPTSKWLTDASKAKLDAFRAAGGIVADLNTLSRVPRTLLLRGGNSALRVMKRIDGETSIYFLVNSNRDAVDTEIVFPEGGRVVRFEADTGRSFVAASDGRIRRRFAGGESAIYFAGKTDDADQFVEAGKPVLTLGDGWTAQKVAEYLVGSECLEHRMVVEEPRPIRLGDWRQVFGETFSGRVVYRTEFAAKDAGPAEIDLGEVRYCAGITLNGHDLGKRFFGPYKWRGFLKKGVNRLEVEVCNLLVNQTGDEEIRSRINRDHPPRSSYDVWQRPFDLMNHDSGLYGPVTVAPIAYGEAQPTACPKSAQVNRSWTGDGFWDRRHAEILDLIAKGPKDYDCVFVGDSITHNWTGWSASVDLVAASNAYRIGRVKFAPSPGLPVWREMAKKRKLLNLGLAGDDTANVLWRLQNGELLGYKSRNFVVMIGTNSYDGQHPDGIAAGIYAIVNEIAERHPESRIILLPIFPRGPSVDSPERVARERTNRVIRSFADGERVVWLDFNDRFLTADGNLPAALFPDFLHPLEGGYRIWREALKPFLD